MIDESIFPECEFVEIYIGINDTAPNLFPPSESELDAYRERARKIAKKNGKTCVFIGGKSKKKKRWARNGK